MFQHCQVCIACHDRLVSIFGLYSEERCMDASMEPDSSSSICEMQNLISPKMITGLTESNFWSKSQVYNGIQRLSVFILFVLSCLLVQIWQNVTSNLKNSCLWWWVEGTWGLQKLIPCGIISHGIGRSFIYSRVDMESNMYTLSRENRW